MASTANNANLISSLTTNFNVTPYYDDFNSGEKDFYRIDRKSTRLNSSHMSESRMPSSA